MNIRKFAPSPPLVPFIKSFLVIETPEEITPVIFPDTTISWVFTYQGRLTASVNDSPLPYSFMSGIRKGQLSLKHLKNTVTIIALFREGIAALFSNEPLHLFNNKIISLEEVIAPIPIKRFEEKFKGSTSIPESIFLIESFLIHQINFAKTDSIIEEAIQLILNSKGSIKIKNLLDTLSISRDPFEKRFRKTVGASPKQFSKIARFKNILRSGNAFKNSAQMALAAGYFDQAHFIKEFKTFTGQTPSDFFKNAHVNNQ